MTALGLNAHLSDHPPRADESVEDIDPVPAARRHALSTWRAPLLMGQTRQALASSLRVNVRNLTPVTGAIRAVPVLACVALGLAIGGSRGAIAMAIGANLIALLSLYGRPGLPLKMALYDTAGIGIAVFLGSATGKILWLHLVTLIGVCFVAGMLVAVGSSQGTAGVQAVIAFLVIGRFSADPHRAVELSALVMLGAGIETASLLLLRVPPSLRVQRSTLADAYEALAAIAERDPNNSHIDLTTTIDNAERTLQSPSLFGRSDAQDLLAILDQAKRARRQLTAIAGLRSRLSHDGRVKEATTLDSCIEAASTTLRALALGLRRPSQRTAWRSPSQDFMAEVAQLSMLAGDRLPLDATDEVLVAQCARYLTALGGQLRAAGNLLEGRDARTVSRASRRSPLETLRVDLDHLAEDVDLIRSNLTMDSPVLRHAIRLSVAVPLAALLAALAGVPRAYWVPYSVAVILKPDYTSLLSRGLGRTLGVLFGATIAAAVVAALHPGLAGTTLLIGGAAWVAYSAWGVSFPVAIGFDTAFLLFLLSLEMPDTLATAGDRFLDIVLGGLVALVAYLIWPSPPRSGVDNALRDLFATLADYLSSVFSLLENAPVEPAIIKARSRASRQAWAAAQAAVGRSVDEPKAVDREVAADRNLLSCALRIARVTHALRIDAELGTTIETSEAYRSFVNDVLDDLGDLSTSIGADREIDAGNLRARYTAAHATLGSGERADAVRLHLDELVNAIDTALFLTAAEESELT